MVSSSVPPEYPVYYRTPIKWLSYHAHWRPHLFFSLVLGLTFPVLAISLTPLRRQNWYPDHIPLPDGYPKPEGPRDPTLKGYDD